MSTVTIGRTAEDIAAGALEGAGFVVLWRNLRLGPLELDLVAQHEDLVVIAEVRFRGRGAYASPLASITRAKRRTLIRAARILWRTHLRHRHEIRRLRIDVIAVTPDKVEWIKGAITADDT